MKRIIIALLAAIASIALPEIASAQICDGSAAVTVGQTTDVYIGDAYRRTLDKATNITYSWRSGNTAVLAVKSSTKDHATIEGIAPSSNCRLYYQCSYMYDGYARSANFYYDITVSAGIVKVTRVELSVNEITLTKGETFQLEATAYPTTATNRSFNWTTDRAAVACVTSYGLVTAEGPGTTVISCYAADGSGCRDICTVTVVEEAHPEVYNLEIALPGGSAVLPNPEGQTVFIRPDSGSILHSVHLGDTDVTDDLDGEAYTVPALSGHTTLRVVFEQPSQTTSLAQNTAGQIEILVHGRHITVRGLDDGTTLRLYNAAGTLLLTTDWHEFESPATGLVILSTPTRTFKFVI